MIESIPLFEKLMSLTKLKTLQFLLEDKSTSSDKIILN